MRIRQTGAGESAVTVRAGRRWCLPGYALAWAGGCGLALATLTYSAGAQEAVSPEATQATGQNVRNQAYTRLARSCQVDYRRLCPDQDAGTPPTPRATLLCLKFYKTSLALGCRNAINAVQRQ